MSGMAHSFFFLGKGKSTVNNPNYSAAQINTCSQLGQCLLLFVKGNNYIGPSETKI